MSATLARTPRAKERYLQVLYQFRDRWFAMTDLVRAEPKCAGAAICDTAVLRLANALEVRTFPGRPVEFFLKEEYSALELDVFSETLSALISKVRRERQLDVRNTFTKKHKLLCRFWLLQWNDPTVERIHRLRSDDHPNYDIHGRFLRALTMYGYLIATGESFIKSSQFDVDLIIGICGLPPRGFGVA